MSHHSGSQSETGLLSNVLKSLTTSVSRRPTGSLWIVALVSVISLVITVRFLTFKTNRADLIDPTAPFHQRWLHLTERFGDHSDVVVVVEGNNADRIRNVLDDLGQRLEAEPDLFSHVLYRVDAGDLKTKALQYVSPADLEHAIDRLEMYAPILEGHWSRAGLDSYCLRLNNYITESSKAGEQAVVQGGVHQADQLIRSLGEFLEDPQKFTSPWPEIVSSSAFPQQDVFQTEYQLTSAGTMGFLMLVPRQSTSDFSGKSSALPRLREITSSLEVQYGDVQLGLTGIPVLEADEMERSQADMVKASLISFAGVGLVLLIGFRGFRHPMLALLMLAIGLIWSLGYTTIVVGHLNILSVSFAAILIGLGIDFAIHYLARYLELRHHGGSLLGSLVTTSTGVGTGIVTASVTTSLAFLCATFTDFLGVAELGVIAGGGILLCAVATFVVLPALITLADREIEPRRLPTPFQGNLLRQLTSRYPMAVSLTTLAIIVVIGAQGFTFREGRIFSRVEYDSNLLNLQAEGVESVELQKRVFQESNGSLLYAVSLTKSAQAARQLKEKLLALPTVSHVEELGSYMPAYPAAETNLLVQAVHARLQRISDLPREFPQLDPLSIGHALEGLLETLRAERTLDEAQQAAFVLDQFLTQLDHLELRQQLEILAGYQQAMLTALHRQFQAIADISDPKPVSASDFPDAVRRRFVSDEGDWQVRVFPTEQIWDEAPLSRFVKDVRSVDPDVTGTPLQNFEAARQIQASYLNAAIYALGVIALILLVDSLRKGALIVSLVAPLAVIAFAVVTVHGSGQSWDPLWLVSLYVVVTIAVAAVFDFPSVRNTFLALLPPVAGGFLMFGVLGIMDIDLNPANLIVLPLILGIGVDDGVHVIHDFRLQKFRYVTSPSTINAVTVTSLTSMIGFGSMLVAAHQGLVTLGAVLLVGVGSCLFVSLVTLPAVLTLLDRGQPSEPDSADSDADESPHVVPISVSHHVA